MNTVPSRRWFQYSLRTLFVVLTGLAILSAWGAYQLNWMRQRRALLEERGVAVSFTPSRRPPSFGLWLLGERGATGVYLHYPRWTGVELSEANEAQKTQARRLYPEAKIEVWRGTIMPMGHPGWRITPPARPTSAPVEIPASPAR